MILVDANVLIYASLTEAPEHEAAKEWLAGRLAGPVRVGLPWGSLLAFVRITTNRRIVARPLAFGDAWDAVEAWLAEPVAWVPVPTERHAAVLGPLIRTRGLRANDVQDAHIAALAIEHGLTLCTTDGGFSRFPGLRWENPLAPT